MVETRLPQHGTHDGTQDGTHTHRRRPGRPVEGPGAQP